MITISGPNLSLADIAKDIEDDMKRAGVAFIDAAAKSIEHGQLAGPASGKEYPSARDQALKPKGGKFKDAFNNPSPESGPMHQASAPGEQPHADRGYQGGMLSEMQIHKEGLIGLAQTASIDFEDDAAVRAEVLDNGNSKGTLAPRPWRDIATIAGAVAADLETKLS